MADFDVFPRRPIDRGYRILSLAHAIKTLARRDPEASSADDLNAIGEVSESIHEEVSALIDSLDRAELANKPAAQAGGPANV